MKRIVFFLVALLAPAMLYAQSNGIEYQARMLAHVQHLPYDAPVGFAAWGILPNVMKTNPFRTFSLAGVLVKSDARWVEMMAGIRVDSKGTTETALDIRMLEQSLKGVEIFSEVEYNLTTRQWYLSPIITSTLANNHYQLKAGGEFDFFVAPQRTTMFYGPRVSLHFPVRESIIKNVMFATAYKFQVDGKPILRQYLLLNF